MKYFILTMAMVGLSSCWMLEQPEFFWSETITQNENGINYDPVQASVNFETSYHGRIDVVCRVIITTADQKQYSNYKIFSDLNNGDSRICNIEIQTEQKQMLAYRIVFDAVHK